MGSPVQPEARADAALAQAMERLWIRFLPEMQERVLVLENAAAAATEGNLIPDQCRAAESAAHKLAGVLGTFGLAQGTELARELEFSFSHHGGPEDTERLAALVAELHTLIQNRPSAG